MLQEFVNKREGADQQLPLHQAVSFGTLPMVKSLGTLSEMGSSVQYIQGHSKCPQRRGGGVLAAPGIEPYMLILFLEILLYLAVGLTLPPQGTVLIRFVNSVLS